MLTSLADHARDLDLRLPDQPSFRALQEASRLFDAVASRGLHLDAMHGLLRRNIDENLEVTPDISSGPFVVLYGSRKTTWAILRHTGRNRQIYLSPTHSIATKVAGGRLGISRLKIGTEFDYARFDPTLALVPQSEETAAKGDMHFKDGARYAVDFQGTGAEPAFSLRVNTVPFNDYEWAFDRNTLRAVSMSGVRQAESNLTTILDLLAAVKSPESISHIDPFVRHRMHFVRWKSAQTLSAIDGDAGLRAVRALESDPHPEVRHAARRTLTSAA